MTRAVWPYSARGMWDQGVPMHAFEGTLWPGFSLREQMGTDGTPDEELVIVGSGLILADRGDAGVRNLLERARSSLFIHTSDEELVYDSAKLRARAGVRTWLQCPRPGAQPSDRRLCLGWPYDTRQLVREHAWPLLPLQERVRWRIAAQVNHRSREACFAALTKRADGEAVTTRGFSLGMARHDYLRWLAGAAIAPCPSGPNTPDTFRLYEALELGCLPLVEAAAPNWPNHKHEGDYWRMISAEGPPLIRVGDWSNVHWVIEHYAADPVALQRDANRAQAWWIRQKRQIARDLATDIRELGDATPSPILDGKVTVVITVSPVPSHPSTAMVEETVRRVRAYPALRDAEIIFALDGCRPEQAHRANAYEEHRRRLLQLCNWDPAFRGCFAVVAAEHQHQAWTLREALEYVRAPLVFVVEHDTHPMGDIDFDAIFVALEKPGVHCVRLHIFERVLDEHAYLYGDAATIVGAPLVRTRAWSQRPHLARTEWYRSILAGNFRPRQRAFVEDVMYGKVLNSTSDDRATWAPWGLWIYAPDGPQGMLRSGTVDGRGADPKYPQEL